MKKILFKSKAIILAILFLIVSTSIVKAQNPTNPGFESETGSTITGWQKIGTNFTPSVINTIQRTGSNTLSCVVATTTVQEERSTSYISIPNNDYVHILAWIRSNQTSTSRAYATIGALMGSSNGNSTATSYTQTYTRAIYNVRNTQGSAQNAYVKLNSYSSSTNSRTLYFDDVVIYTSNNSTTDVTEPSAPTGFTNGTITSSSVAFSWTNGSDGGTNPTGIQNTWILRTTNTSAATPVPNDQGQYSTTGGTSGPNTIGTDWTILSTTVAAGTTTYTDNTISAGNSYKYAVIHRDAAYNYSTALVSGTINILDTEPTTQASAVTFSSVSATSMTVSWTNGNGSNRIVLMKSGSAVNSDPVDGTSYTANTTFGSGTQIGTGNYVVYNSTGNSVTVTGLTANTTYYVAVYEFNGSGATVNYLTTNPATGSQLTTLAAPIATTATNIADNSFSANWGTVTGATGYRLDVSTSNTFTSFVSGYNDLDVNNVTTYSVTGLSANTTYYYRIRAYSSQQTSANSNVITTSTSGPIRYSVATGNWNATTTWSYSTGGVSGAPVPTSANTVFIEGADVVTVSATGATCGSLTIGEGTTGTLSIRYATTTGTFTIAGNVNIANNGSFIVTNNTSANVHTVYIAGDLVVDGTLNMCSASDDYAIVIFNGSSQQTISGSGSTCTFFSLTASNTSLTGLVLNRNITIAPTSVTTTTLTVTANDIFDLGSNTCNRSASGAGTLAVNGILRLAGTTGGQSGSNFPLNFNTVTTNGTVEYYSTSDQTVYNRTYTNLILSGAGKKTIGTAVNGSLVSGNLSIAPTGSATASVTNNNVNVGTLTLDGLGVINGTWGSSSSTATYKTNTYFTSGTLGYVTVSTSTCSSPNAPTSGGDQSICSDQSIPALTVTVGAGETADWYANSTGGSPLLSGSTSFTPSGAGTYYAETRNTTSNCISATRTGVTLSITTAATSYAGPDGSSTIGVPYTMSGASASNYAGILWTKSGGTGTFTGTGTLTPTYTPAVGDPSTITFTLTAGGNSPCGDAADDMVLTINAAPLTASWSTTAASTNWFAPGNWAGGVVPGSVTSITIPGGASNYPTLTSDVSCQNITIEDGGSFIGTEHLTVTGTSLAKRNVSADAYHFLASPVNNTTFGDVFPNNQNKIWAQVYDEPTGTWVNQTVSGTLVPGIGYSVWIDPSIGNQTALFSGTFNSLPETETLSLQNNSGDPDKVGWNLLGNPFTSGIDWDNGAWHGGNVDGSVYIWDGAAQNYKSWNGSTGSLTGGVIPPQNGFFVKTNSNNSTITIPLAARVHTNQGYYKDAVPNTLQLGITGNGYHDDTYIQYAPEATSGFDASGDAYKLWGVTGVPQIYSIIPGDVLSINALPSTEANPLVSLGLKVGAETTYTLTASGMNSFDPSVPVRLDDLKLGITRDLRLLDTYTFTAAPGDAENRFNIRFYSPVGMDEPVLSEFYVYANQGKITVNNAGSYQGILYVYNAAGQLLRTQKMEPGIHDVAAFPVGVYIVKAVTGKTIVSHKVVLF